MTNYEMRAKKWAEVKELMEKAVCLLHEPLNCDMMQSWQFAFALSRQPAFHDWIGYHFWLSDNGEVGRLYKVTWDRELDLRMIYEPPPGLRYELLQRPTVYLQRKPLDRETVQSFQSPVESLCQYSGNFSAIVLDGEAWAFESSSVYKETATYWNSGTRHEVWNLGKNLAALLDTFFDRHDGRGSRA